jgi:ATP synthase F1 delta subunit
LIDEFFSGVKAGKVTVLEGESFSGSAAEITSAVPLTDKEQTTVSKDLLTQLGDNAEVAFRVDPSILGGLIIRVGDKVMDNSVASQLNEMRQNLG